MSVGLVPGEGVLPIMANTIQYLRNRKHAPCFYMYQVI